MINTRSHRSNTVTVVLCRFFLSQHRFNVLHTSCPSHPLSTAPPLYHPNLLSIITLSSFLPGVLHLERGVNTCIVSSRHILRVSSPLGHNYEGGEAILLENPFFIRTQLKPSQRPEWPFKTKWGGQIVVFIQHLSKDHPHSFPFLLSKINWFGQNRSD